MSAAHFKTAPFLPGAWWDALRRSSSQRCYRPTDHVIWSPKQLQTCPSHRLWAACCSWDTNCTTSEQPFIWGSSFLKAFPILLKNQQVSFAVPCFTPLWCTSVTRVFFWQPWERDSGDAQKQTRSSTVFRAKLLCTYADFSCHAHWSTPLFTVIHVIAAC